MEFFTDTGSWVLISFLIFAAIVFVKARARIVKSLDDKIEAIRLEIETAEKLRNEAQALLAEYEQRQQDAAIESERIVQTAKEHAEVISRDAEEHIRQTAERRERQLQERLARMEEEALQHIRVYAADLAIKATREIIAEKMDKDDSNRLIEESIMRLPSSFN